MKGKWAWVEKKPWWHRHFVSLLSSLVGLVIGWSIFSFLHPTPDYVLRGELATATWTFSDQNSPYRLEEAIIETETFQAFYSAFLLSAWRHDKRLHKVMQLRFQVALLEVYDENAELLRSYYGIPPKLDTLLQIKELD